MAKNKKIGRIGMVAVTAAAITVGVPIKMAGDILKAERRGKGRRKRRWR